MLQQLFEQLNFYCNRIEQLQKKFTDYHERINNCHYDIMVLNADKFARKIQLEQKKIEKYV